MKTVLSLPFPPSTNNLFSGGAKRRFISKKYKAWREDAETYVTSQLPKSIKGPVVVSMEFQEPNRKSDVDNRLKAPLDLLVHYGLIEADDNTIVREVRAKWSAEVEGVRITIEDFASAILTGKAA